MDGFHIQGMAENEVNTCIIAEVGNPVPTVHAFNTNNDIAEIGFKQLLQFIWVSWNFFMQAGVTRLIYDANVE
jgi:hypothetical protein